MCIFHQGCSHVLENSWATHMQWATSTGGVQDSVDKLRDAMKDTRFDVHGCGVDCDNLSVRSL